MSSLSAKDRVSLCSFTFSDGRRCRTPRLRDNPRFCPYHAQKEARAQAAQTLGKDLAYFFSGDYLSACDLTTALGRLIPAVLRGDVKPRAARTVAYLAQTLLQAIHLSKHEYINAFGTDGWRQSIHNSVRGNYDYRFPPAPKPEQSESPQSHPAEPQPQPAPQPTQPPQSEIPTLSGPAPSPHTPLPPTSAEFAQHLLAGRNLSQSEIPTSSGSAPSQTPSPIPTQAAPVPPATPSPTSSQAQQSEIPTLSGPASPPPSTPPQPAAQPIPGLPSTPPKHAPVAQPLRSLALPLPVRRRLHRAPA